MFKKYWSEFKKYWSEFMKTAKTFNGSLAICLVVGSFFYLITDMSMFDTIDITPGHHVQTSTPVNNPGELTVTSTVNNKSISVNKIDEDSPILDLVEALKKI